MAYIIGDWCSDVVADGTMLAGDENIPTHQPNTIIQLAASNGSAERHFKKEVLWFEPNQSTLRQRFLIIYLFIHASGSFVETHALEWNRCSFFPLNSHFFLD